MYAPSSRERIMVIALLLCGSLFAVNIGLVNCLEITPIQPIGYTFPILVTGSTGSLVYSPSTTVQITIYEGALPTSFLAAVDGGPYMSLSNSNPWTPSTWPLVQNRSWTLNSGDGLKTVYVKFKNGFGDIIGPGTYAKIICSDTITLDTLPPTLQITSANGTTIQQPSYTVNWTAEDSGTGIDHCEIKKDTSAWTNVGDLRSYPFPLTEGPHTIQIKAVDKTGKSTSHSLIVTVAIPPGAVTVLAEPTTKEVKPEENAVFTATASGGSGSYTAYQWYEGSNPLAGGASASLSIKKTTDGTYRFYCNVTDSAGITGKSNDVILTVVTPPEPLQVSAGSTTPVVKVGETATLTANASGGTGPYSFQWFEGSIPIEGETQASLSITKDKAGTYTYYCMVTDTATGATQNTNPVTLTVNAEDGGTATPSDGGSGEQDNELSTTPGLTSVGVAIIVVVVITLVAVVAILFLRKRKPSETPMSGQAPPVHPPPPPPAA